MWNFFSSGLNYFSPWWISVCRWDSLFPNGKAWSHKEPLLRRVTLRRMRRWVQAGKWGQEGRALEGRLQLGWAACRTPSAALKAPLLYDRYTQFRTEGIRNLSTIGYSVKLSRFCLKNKVAKQKCRIIITIIIIPEDCSSYNWIPRGQYLLTQ